MNAVDPKLITLVSDLSHRALPTIRRAGLCLLVLFVVTLGLWVGAPFFNQPSLAALRGSRLLPISIGALAIGLASLTGAAIMTSARLRALDPVPTPEPRRRLARFRRRSGDLVIGRAARWPQALIVAPIALSSLVFANLPLAGAPPSPVLAIELGALAVLLSFPLLIVERVFAAMPIARLPEVGSVRRLLLVPVLAWPAAGLISIAGGLGLTVAPMLDAAVAVMVSLIAVELGLRAAARAFLPPPAPVDARAATDSMIAQLLADIIGSRSFGTPVGARLRGQFGIDFSRSWALVFFRRAALPIATVLGLFTWGLSGLVLVGIDSRAIYERFGAPVAVLGPGLHAILPWPMGRTRRLEYGVLHEIAPGLGDVATSLAAAEGPAPPDADRLWEQAHPAEQTLLVASLAAGTNSKQSFQVVSADIRLRYRIGMTDADALAAAYAAADPEALMRAIAGRVITRFAAGQRLEQLLGENRERLGETLRTAIQSRLDADRTGLEVTAVVVEAIHPPAGAAEAYHAVQAAGIIAAASVSAERGRAAATLAHAAQYAASLVDQAQAAGAEATARAVADTASFVADRDSAAAHPVSFPLERRLATLGTSLAKSVLTIVDHRIPAMGAPTIDLRPLTPLTAVTTPPNAE